MQETETKKTKKGDSRRHKGCFASKRKIQSIRNLATAKKERTQVKENLPEEEKDCESPRKIKTRSHQHTKYEVDICGTRLIELSVLRNELKSCSSCKRGPLSLTNIMEENQSGLSSIFNIKCSFCSHVNEVKSSAEHRAGSHGPLVTTEAAFNAEDTSETTLFFFHNVYKG
ncbi:uncharacterized protein LOC113664916 [Pocillopora damicornis]|uniref:uncharacterized protein LOC113664916 n=1 Tax=Pocillopora damicornis TaxID=46731 RepID=UPI000F5569E0|nr:uncharacterized protein LOC113664916 [Pocillopora damicornis]